LFLEIILLGYAILTQVVKRLFAGLANDGDCKKYIDWARITICIQGSDNMTNTTTTTSRYLQKIARRVMTKEDCFRIFS